MKANRLIRLIPNILTTANMLLGILVLFIVICQKGEANRLASCIMILIAVGLDCLDGMMAKSFNAESPLGKQLDSFADFVSFGLAPLAVLLTHNSFRDLGLIMYLSVSFYAISAAYRLARFNTGDFADFFLGLPITAAGFILTSTNLVLHFYAVSGRPFAVMPVIVLIYILSVLMASRIKIYRPSFRKKR
ncbi:MAG TPA: CDP-diacylglycerol--serine O-phosphatidyltransferase [Clostridiales bacterium]|jgi:CDP-diacylglycerol--serine O-phosphatidyltransferase|nr:CDP-diacylglycerol--serine O-phosphatidyltransferase [Clostridiales bacterium]